MIGSGAYGQVLLARHKLTGAYRALKVVWKDAFNDTRPYLREFEAIKRFEPISRRAEGFVQVLHVGSLEDAFYYVMELADDQSGHAEIDPDSYSPRLLSRQGSAPLPLQHCIEIGVHLARALEVLHRERLIHRDIKPANIIFVRGRPKLADIGLVAQIEQANSFVGTAGFVPPEGPIRPESDLYSLGKVLYEIATGRDRCEFPELPHDLGADSALYLELNQIILKACDPRPERRYANAEAMRQELELLQAGASIQRLRRAEKRLRRVAVVFALSAVLGGALFLAKSIHDQKRAAVERRVAYLVTRGTDHMTDGDYAAALPFFLEAARDDPSNQRSHQLRIGSLLAGGMARKGTWSHPSTLGSYSHDGQFLVLHNQGQLEIRSSTNGMLVESISAQGLNLAGYSYPPFQLAPGLRQIGLLAETDFMLLERGSGEARRFPCGDSLQGMAFLPDGQEVLLCAKNGVILLNLRSGAIRSRPMPFPATSAAVDDAGRRAIVLSLDGPAQVVSLPELQPISVVFEHDMAYAGAFHPFLTNLVLTTGFDKAAYWDIETGQIASKHLDHEYGNHCLAISPNRTLLASGGLDRSVRLCDSRTLLPIRSNPVLYHPDRVSTLSFVDDETLVVHCADGSAHAWSLNTRGLQKQELEFRPWPDRHEASRAGISLAADGNLVRLSIEGQAPATLKLDYEVGAVAIHPEGTTFAIGTVSTNFEHHSAKVYRRNNPASPAFELRHLDGITHISYSPTGRRIATSSEDHTALVWDAQTGQPLVSPLRHKWQVQCAAFDSEERWVATASWDQTVVIWDVNTGEPLTAPIEFGVFLQWVEFCDDDNSILAGNAPRRRLIEAQLPLAPVPLDRWKDALPAPVGQVLYRSEL